MAPIHDNSYQRLPAPIVADEQFACLGPPTEILNGRVFKTRSQNNLDGAPKTGEPPKHPLLTSLKPSHKTLRSTPLWRAPELGSPMSRNVGFSITLRRSQCNTISAGAAGNFHFLSSRWRPEQSRNGAVGRQKLADALCVVEWIDLLHQIVGILGAPCF